MKLTLKDGVRGAGKAISGDFGVALILYFVVCLGDDGIAGIFGDCG